MLVEVGQDRQEQLKLPISHRLHDEASIMAEEEEATGGASSFTRLEDLVSV